MFYIGLKQEYCKSIEIVLTIKLTCMQQVFNIFPLNSHALFFSNKRLKIRIIVSYKNNFVWQIFL